MDKIGARALMHVQRGQLGTDVYVHWDVSLLLGFD
jgi:hypothetical protein